MTHELDALRDLSQRIKDSGLKDLQSGAIVLDAMIEQLQKLADYDMLIVPAAVTNGQINRAKKRITQAYENAGTAKIPYRDRMRIYYKAMVYEYVHNNED